MIVVEIKLLSAISIDRNQELGTMIIDNITSEDKHLSTCGKKGDYRARMYRKGDLKKHGNARSMVANARPIREGSILGHSRVTEPVHNLVAKALTSMGYG